MDNTIYVQWSDDGQHIRKWSRGPFEGAVMFHQSETGAALTSEGVENIGCNYCGAQVALMSADYLEQLADALDKVGAPRKSPDGNEHYGLEKRIAALAQPVEAGEDG